MYTLRNPSAQFYTLKASMGRFVPRSLLAYHLFTTAVIQKI
jgi:hypothetical protein